MESSNTSLNNDTNSQFDLDEECFAADSLDDDMANSDSNSNSNSNMDISIRGKRKCGEIFYNERNIISFCCYICEAECEQLDKFLQHLVQHSLTVKHQEDDTVESLEIVKLQASASESAHVELLQDEEEYNSETDVHGISFEVAYLPSIEATASVPGRPTKPPEVEQILAFKCNLCPRTYDDTKKLKAHLRRHARQQTYSCDLCDAKFNENSNLKAHRYRHLGIKPYSCELCDKRFTSSTELRLHKRTHTGEKPYMCNECGKCYSNSAHLTAHLRRHRNERNHVCATCGKSYFDRKTLTEHLSVHTGARPHVCSTCKATFPRRKALVEHMKLHSGVKRHVCKICGKSFAQNAGLYSHMKIHPAARKTDKTKSTA